ncbi:TonB-dependent receptor plug domain-containing protein [Paracoccus indicus]|uniref:TonB-dependent receptor plug domain-containing protein n=1 Tax=Paracoccus indicus TaxID=2079229 RepID=UPI0013B3C1E2|nr:TonB-dependent receptor [Paracoccus indicus]
MPLLSRLCLATALTAPCIAAAQEAPVMLPPIIMSANQTASQPGRTGADVQIVTREDLHRDGTTRLVDYLATLPGVSVTSNGGFGTQSTLRLRGLPTQYVKVLVDGIDVSDPSAPQIRFDAGAMLTGDIARIEVLKGPQSALYGSEAIGGVVSITTLDADRQGLHQQAGVEYGSNNSTRLSYGVQAANDTQRAALTVQHYETDGFSVADENDGNTEDDGARATRVTLSASQDLTPALTVGVAGFWQKTRVDTDGDFPVLVDNADRSAGIMRGARVFADYTMGATEHGLSVQRSETSRQETFGGFTYPYEGERTEYAYDGSTLVGQDVTLAWGASHSDERFQGDATDARYLTNSLYAEAQWVATPDLDIALSARHDHNSQFGGKETGRLAIAWRATDSITLRGQHGSGYRAPSPYELYATWGGNPDLTPETAIGTEIGLDYAPTADSSFGVTLFRTKINNLIDYSLDDFDYQQITGDSRTQGIELTGETAITDRIRLSGNLTYTDTRDPNGDPLNCVPERSATLRVAGDLDTATRASLQAVYQDGLLDDGSEMPSFTVLNAQIERDLTPTTTGYLRVENLLDREYQVLEGYGTSDRAIFAGLRASF